MSKPWQQEQISKIPQQITEYSADVRKSETVLLNNGAELRCDIATLDDANKKINAYKDDYETLAANGLLNVKHAYFAVNGVQDMGADDWQEYRIKQNTVDQKHIDTLFYILEVHEITSYESFDAAKTAYDTYYGGL